VPVRTGVCLAFCVAVLCAPVASASRTVAGPRGAVAFWTARRGLVGTGSAQCAASCSGTVAVTADGGRTWRTVLRTSDAVVQLAAAGRGAAWAVVRHCASLDCRSRVWRTSDGGRSWTRVGAGLNAVSFATPRVGLGLETTPTTSRLYRSEDGGRAWRAVADPCHGLEAAAMSLVTATNGFVVCAGEPGAGAESKAVYETLDGGREWERHSIAVLGSAAVTSLPVAGYVEGAAFAPSGYGALCQSRGPFLVTRDGGRTWSATRAVRPEIDFCTGVATVPGATYALVDTAQRDRLEVSTDAGRTWRTATRF
jgi:photosystem II stability/assembly factor-like uncharacterized protein